MIFFRKLTRQKELNKMIVKFLFLFLLQSAAAQQYFYKFGNYNQKFMTNQIPSPIDEEIREYIEELPDPTIADEAKTFWKEQSCVYPPQEFWTDFDKSCSEAYNDNNIYSGLCKTFFNSSQQLCLLENAEDDEKETMLRISELQKDVTDDDICDTLVGLKQSYPDLFPIPVGDDKWFSHTNNLLFLNESCRDICSMPNLHAVCFGILLNYDYINNQRLATQLEKDLGMSDDGEDEDEEDDFYEGDYVIADDIIDGIDIGKLLNDFDLTYDDLYKDDNNDDNNIPVFDEKDAMEKYYDYKVVDDASMEEALEALKEEFEDLAKFGDDGVAIEEEDVLFAIDYSDFGNPKILNKLRFEGNIDEPPAKRLELTNSEWEELYGYEEQYDADEQDSFMGAVLAFSCLLLLVVVAYIVKMRHRLFGRGNRAGRPNRWNYKKVNTEAGHY